MIKYKISINKISKIFESISQNTNSVTLDIDINAAIVKIKAIDSDILDRYITRRPPMEQHHIQSGMLDIVLDNFHVNNNNVYCSIRIAINKNGAELMYLRAHEVLIVKVKTVNLYTLKLPINPVIDLRLEKYFNEPYSGDKFIDLVKTIVRPGGKDDEIPVMKFGSVAYQALYLSYTSIGIYVNDSLYCKYNIVKEEE